MILKYRIIYGKIKKSNEFESDIHKYMISTNDSILLKISYPDIYHKKRGIKVINLDSGFYPLFRKTLFEEILGLEFYISIYPNIKNNKISIFHYLFAVSVIEAEKYNFELLESLNTMKKYLYNYSKNYFLNSKYSVSSEYTVQNVLDHKSFKDVVYKSFLLEV